MKLLITCFLWRITRCFPLVVLTDEEFKYLNIYVKDIRPQVSPKDNTVFVSWSEAEIKILKDIFSEEIDGILTFDVIKAKLKTVDMEANDRQIYDKLRSLKSQTMSRLQKVSTSSQEYLQSKQEQNEKKV